MGIIYFQVKTHSISAHVFGKTDWEIHIPKSPADDFVKLEIDYLWHKRNLAVVWDSDKTTLWSVISY